MIGIRRVKVPKRVGTLLATALFFSALTAAYYYQKYLTLLENNVENTAQEALHQLAYTGREYSNIQDQIETISDLLGHSQSLYEYLRQPNRVNRSILEDMWISVAINQKLYKQIRFLDVSGREKVRINYDIETGAALPAIKLQNKSERDYFQFAKNLDDGEIASWGIGLEREIGRAHV